MHKSGLVCASQLSRKAERKLTLVTAQSDNVAWRRTLMVPLEPCVFAFEDLDHTAGTEDQLGRMEKASISFSRNED